MYSLNSITYQSMSYIASSKMWLSGKPKFVFVLTFVLLHWRQRRLYSCDISYGPSMWVESVLSCQMSNCLVRWFCSSQESMQISWMLCLSYEELPIRFSRIYDSPLLLAFSAAPSTASSHCSSLACCLLLIYPSLSTRSFWLNLLPWCARSSFSRFN